MKRNRYVTRAYPAPVVRGVNRYRLKYEYTSGCPGTMTITVLDRPAVNRRLPWWKRLLRRWGLV